MVRYRLLFSACLLSISMVLGCGGGGSTDPGPVTGEPADVLTPEQVDQEKALSRKGGE